MARLLIVKLASTLTGQRFSISKPGEVVDFLLRVTPQRCFPLRHLLLPCIGTGMPSGDPGLSCLPVFQPIGPPTTLVPERVSRCVHKQVTRRTSTQLPGKSAACM